MMRGALKLFVLVVCVLVGASRSEATTITFSGSGTSGTISTPPSSIGWEYPGFSSGTFAWGSPGLFNGTESWGGASTESEFTITFAGLPAGVSISPVDTTNGGSTTTTRFDDVSTGFAWTGTISGGGSTVTFFAPAGEPLSPGNTFFVNVVFTGNAGSTVNFTGAFDPQLAAVPEPASMLLLGTGLIGFGARRWRNRRQRG